MKRQEGHVAGQRGPKCKRGKVRRRVAYPVEKSHMLQKKILAGEGIGRLAKREKRGKGAWTRGVLIKKLPTSIPL